MKRLLLVLACLVPIAGTPLFAAETLGPQISSRSASTAEEKAQEAARHACKIEICDVIATREANGPDVACNIGWTWHAEEIVDVLDERVDWSWGKTVCETKLRLKRAPLADMTNPARTAIELGTQKVHCTLHEEGKGHKKAHKIEIELSPRITVNKGRTTAAKAHWGDVSAPAAIYPLLYAATGLDNSTNLLGPELVRQVNKFVSKDCAAVKDALPGRRVN